MKDAIYISLIILTAFVADWRGYFAGRNAERSDSIAMGVGEYYIDDNHQKQFRYRFSCGADHRKGKK